MLTLFLIRHGETDAVGKSIVGWQPGWPLNEMGRAQAERLAATLSQFPITAIYTSPLERAVQTANPIAAQQNLIPRLSNSLGEWRPGAWEGERIAELDRLPEWHRFNAFRTGVRPPGGESMLEVQVRMVQQIQCMEGQHGGEVVAAVSHAEPIRAALAHYMGVSLDLALRFEIGTASVSVVRIDAWGPKILSVNGMGDLLV